MYTSATPKTPAPSPASLLRQTGAGYFPIALIARLPFAMMVVGVLTLVVAARDTIALGGATSALTGLGTALIGPHDLHGRPSSYTGVRVRWWRDRPSIRAPSCQHPSLANLKVARVSWSRMEPV